MQNSTIRTLARIGFLTVIFTPFTAGAWGRRGHQVIGETAAVLASDEPNSTFMKNQSFNFGYYANVPDFIWKRSETYDYEKPQHFMDMEIFNRAFAAHPEIKDPLNLSRQEFEAKFPDVKPDAGRAFWRIREMYADLEKTTEQLKALKEPTGEARQKLQERWLLVAGMISHYVGDLSMPLHVSENYDGMMTGQKGVHSYFEEITVDELYPEIGCEVSKEAKLKWAAFTKKNKDKQLVELLKELADRSNKQIGKLLAMDKKFKREDVKKNALTWKPLIKQQLVDGSLILAEVFRRQLGWTFDNNKFYYFAEAPAYMMPGEKLELPPVKAKAKP